MYFLSGDPMKSEELRALQAPLKRHYQEQPAAALIALEADDFIGRGITCKVDIGGTLAEAGLHFRGTLGVDRESPVAFGSIRLSFELDSGDDDERPASLLKLTERYCAVLQKLQQLPEIRVSHWPLMLGGDGYFTLCSEALPRNRRVLRLLTART